MPEYVSELARMASEAIAAELAERGICHSELRACPAYNRQLTIQWLIDRNLVDQKKLNDELK